MRIASLLLWLRAICALRKRDYEAKEYYAVELRPGADPWKEAARLGLEYESKLGELPHHHMFYGKQSNLGSDSLQRRESRRAPSGSVKWIQKQVPKRLHKRQLVIPEVFPSEEQSDQQNAAIVARQVMLVDKLGIHDRIFPEQWHLLNTVQAGQDVNATGLWEDGITGHNATVAIVDDGIDMDSRDIADNYFAKGSYDFNDHGDEPRPRLFDDTHGTRCASEVAGVKNDVCGIGVAYNSKVAGIRILSATISDADEAVALNYAFNDNHIYSCSWGPPDDGQAMEGPGILIRRAFVNGVQNGRDKKGSIYVFATGNGAAHDDNCNFDGYTNSIYSITTGAIDRKGLHPYYSESCSAQLVVTYSSGSGDYICIDTHGGTSAAAPLAAGIFALVLSVRPDLTWRDLQYLCVDTAVPVNLDDEDWKPTPYGKMYNHKFGYGKLDAWAIVEAAKTFESVKPQAWYFSPLIHVDHDIPQGDVGLSSQFNVDEEMFAFANIEALEHVTVTVNIQHQRRGDVAVDLISPEGIVSHLGTTRQHDDSADGFVNWTFMSVKHWGEKGHGSWTLLIKDESNPDKVGRWVDWRINFWGMARDAKSTRLLPLPGEEGDHENLPLITTAPVSHVPLPTQTKFKVLPSETHPSRPVNTKPDVDTPGSDKEIDTEPDKAKLIPSWFPSFGARGKNVYWIYGGFAVVLVFISAVGIYFGVRRRNAKRRKAFDGYEFEALRDGENGHNIRAGNLYNAFGDDDAEELETFELGGEDSDGESDDGSRR